MAESYKNLVSQITALYPSYTARDMRNLLKTGYAGTLTETGTVPGTGNEYTILLAERIASNGTLTVTSNGDPLFAQPHPVAPDADEFAYGKELPTIRFHPSREGETYSVEYTALGAPIAGQILMQMMKEIEVLETHLNTVAPSDVVNVTHGGTNLTSVAQGDLLYGSASNVYSKLAKSTSATRYLSNTGTNNNPAWAQINLTDGVSGTLPVTNGGTGAASLTANNVLLGNGTSALQVVAPGTSGNVLTSNGTTWTSAANPSHTQNTDTGTDSIGFTIGLGSASASEVQLHFEYDDGGGVTTAELYFDVLNHELVFLETTGGSGGTIVARNFRAELAGGFIGPGALITALNATELTSGTIPDARFPATLPAVSGANLTNLDATDLTGTIADARLPAEVPLTDETNTFTAANTFSNAGNDLRGKVTINATGDSGTVNLIVSNTSVHVTAANVGASDVVVANPIDSIYDGGMFYVRVDDSGGGFTIFTASAQTTADAPFAWRIIH